MAGNRFTNRIVAVVFVVGIALPLLQQLTGLFPTVAVVDNRPLAPAPSLSSIEDALGAFPGRFEAWYADHLGLRGALVTGYRWLTDALLHSPDRVIIGEDGWLYLRRGVRADIETVPLVRDWCGRFPFPKHELDHWVAALTANHEWLSERGIDYLLVMPPNKMTAVPEHLPDRVHCRRGVRRVQQLERTLAAGGRVEPVAMPDVLRQTGEDGQPLWFSTDTHWNARGIAAAYPALVQRIRELQPAARRIGDLELRALGRGLGDLGRMIHGLRVESDVIWAVSPAEPRSRPAPTPFPEQADFYGRRTSARVVDDPDLPRAVVLHDSFFDGSMNDLLAESFSRTVFIHHGRPEIDRAAVDKERPDIVIHEMVERNLLNSFYAP